jgi:hypothetical protein
MPSPMNNTHKWSIINPLLYRLKTSWSKLHFDGVPNKFCKTVHFLKQRSIGAILNSPPPQIWVQISNIIDIYSFVSDSKHADDHVACTVRSFCARKRWDMMGSGTQKHVPVEHKMLVLGLGACDSPECNLQTSFIHLVMRYAAVWGSRIHYYAAYRSPPCPIAASGWRIMIQFLVGAFS